MVKSAGDGNQTREDPARAITSLELRLMNSRVREWLLRYWDFPLFDSMLKRHHLQLRNAAVLEAGCGSGYSTLMIWEHFQPRILDAFDVVSEQIERARSRNIPARFFVADVTDTRLGSSLYEAAFVCGVLHHTEQWQVGLAEVSRVLKSGGLLLLEEPTRPFTRFERRIIGPSAANEAWHGLRSLKAEMLKVGLSVVEERPLYFGLFGSYMCVKMEGAAERQPCIAPALLLNDADELAHGQGVPA